MLDHGKRSALCVAGVRLCEGRKSLAWYERNLKIVRLACDRFLAKRGLLSEFSFSYKPEAVHDRQEKAFPA
jgi:hypothetical protein